MNIAHPAAVEIRSQIALPLYLHSAQAGFDSPIDEDEPAIDLNEMLIRHCKETFIARMRGDSLRERGLYDGDLLIVDRKLKPGHGDLVIAALEGELLCRELDLRNSCLLATEGEAIALGESAELRIEGVVTGAVRCLR